MLMRIFFFCCQPTTNMAFRLVDINNFTCLRCKCRIYLNKTFCNIFMYCALADSKVLGSLSHRCIMFNHIICYFNGTFFNISFQ